MKALPALFGHSQAGVRDKAKEVSVQLAAYLGAGVVAGVLLDKMPAAMRKDVDAAIADLPPGKQQPSRYTRREAAERAARDADAAPMDVDGEDGGEGGAAGAAEVVEEEQVRLAGGSVWPRSWQGRRGCWLPHEAAVMSTRGAGRGTSSRCAHLLNLPFLLQEGDPYDYAAPVDILALLAKAQCQVGGPCLPLRQGSIRMPLPLLCATWCRRFLPQWPTLAESNSCRSCRLPPPQVDDDPPVAFWAALEDKKWGLRKVGFVADGRGAGAGSGRPVRMLLWRCLARACALPAPTQAAATPRSSRACTTRFTSCSPPTGRP